MIKPIAALILVLTLCACQAAFDGEDFDQAVRLFKAGQYDQAQPFAERAYQSAPLIPKHGAILAWISLKQGRQDRAESLLAELKSYAQAYVETMQLDAWMTLMRGDHVKAANLFAAQDDWAQIHRGRSYYPRKYFPKDVAFIDQIHWDAQHGLGLAAAGTKDWDKAIPHLEIAAQARTYASSNDALLALAGIHLERGQADRALSLLATADKDGTLGLAPVALAIRLLSPDACQARAAASEADRRNPGYAFYPAILALAQAACGQAAQADLAMDRALRISFTPLDPALLQQVWAKHTRIRQWMLAYGEKLYLNGSYALVRQFLGYSPDCRPQMQAAWADHYAGLAQQALVAFQDLERKACPHQGEIVTGQGLAHLALGQLDQAERILTKASRIDPAYGRARVALGAVAYKRGDWGKAIQLYKAHLDAIPDRERSWSWGSHALNNLGWAYYFSGRYDLAADIFQSLAEYLPHPPAAALAGQGWALLRLGQTDQARGLFENALKADPTLVLALQGLGAVTKGL